MTEKFRLKKTSDERQDVFTLADANEGVIYTIREIDARDEDMETFLLRLGCYSGEPVTLIKKRRSGCIVAIRDGRYNLDSLLSRAIILNDIQC